VSTPPLFNFSYSAKSSKMSRANFENVLRRDRFRRPGMIRKCKEK
jgi:hypothetical protein